MPYSQPEGAIRTLAGTYADAIFSTDGSKLFVVSGNTLSVIDEIGSPTLRQIEASHPAREREGRLEQIGMSVANPLPCRIRPGGPLADAGVRDEQDELIGPFDRKRTKKQAASD